MQLKNYTSTVAAERTVARIERLLADAGASAIMKDYEQGRLRALQFRLPLPDGQNVAVRLPVNPAAVLAVLRKQVRRMHEGTLRRLEAQADRTAWKLMQDWVEVQLSLIRLQQADALQVFMPYVWDGRRTFYAAVRDRNYRELPQLTETTKGAGS
jgi:hypothetical protein